MTRRLVLATRNEHKVHELRQILAGLVDELGLEVVGADDVEGARDPARVLVRPGRRHDPTSSPCGARHPARTVLGLRSYDTSSQLFLTTIRPTVRAPDAWRTAP